MTSALAEQGSRTKITWRMLFESVAESDRVKKFAVEANERNLDRLEAELAKMAWPSPQIVRVGGPMTLVAEENTSHA